MNNLGFALMIWNLGGSNTFDLSSAIATRAGATNFQPMLAVFALNAVM
jgi:hypothetical protein